MVGPQWGAFITQMGLLREGALITTKIRQDIAMGVETGDYDVPSIEIASDVLMEARVEVSRGS